MKCGVVACAILFLCNTAIAEDRNSKAPQPEQFEIGRLTFFDFGPPFDFYEIFIVRPATAGTSIERITLTPPGHECSSTAKIEVASALITESVATLFGATNPCAIPEKALRRERKRCKKCLALSGADVVMQVQCGTETRLIRTDILDSDWFDAAPHTPEHTSWTIQLLGHLDKALGPGGMDKPIFPMPENGETGKNVVRSRTLPDVGAGEYDALFHGASDKPSDLYRAAKNPPAPPTVRLLKSGVPLPPELVIPKDYPPLARVTGIEGIVSFTIEVSSDGSATNLVFSDGHPLLRPSVTDVVSRWRFPEESAGQQIQITIEFALNCPPKAE
jgi:hypothetical protein